MEQDHLPGPNCEDRQIFDPQRNRRRTIFFFHPLLYQIWVGDDLDGASVAVFAIESNRLEPYPSHNCIHFVPLRNQAMNLVPKTGSTSQLSVLLMTTKRIVMFQKVMLRTYALEGDLDPAMFHSLVNARLHCSYSSSRFCPASMMLLFWCPAMNMTQTGKRTDRWRQQVQSVRIYPACKAV